MLLASRGLPLNALCFASLALAVNPASAAEAPIWKFEPGAVNRYRLTQEMATTMELGAGGRVTTNTTSIMDMSWTIVEVKADGSADVRQKFDRIRMSLKIPGGADVEFDTQSTDEPQGFAAMIAPLLREMSRAEILVTMTARGKITVVEVPETLVAALATSPGVQFLGDLATAEGIKKTISRVFVELPETLEPGVEWRTTAMNVVPELGEQAISTTYRYFGPKEIDGVEYEAFTPALVTMFSGGAADIQVAKEGSSGELLFNRAAGRLESSTLDHDLTLAIKQSGRSSSLSIEQSTELKWMPAGEEQVEK